MQEDRARAEALLYFNGKHTNGASTNGSVDDSEVLDPALQELVTLIDSQLEALQKQMTQLNDCLEVRFVCGLSVKCFMLTDSQCSALQTSLSGCKALLACCAYRGRR